MKKALLLVAIIVVSVTYFSLRKTSTLTTQETAPLTEMTSDIDDNGEKSDGDSLIAQETLDRTSSHQEKILKKVLQKKHVETEEFRQFIAKKQKAQKKPLSAKQNQFYKATYTALLKCYQDGCGEEPDHQGFYHAGKTVAVISLNKILKQTLDAGTSPEWMSDSQLLELFNTPNKNTRELALKHVLARGNEADQIEKVMESTSDLNGYSYSDTVTHLLKSTSNDNKDRIINSLVINLADKGPLAKLDTLYALEDQKTQITRAQWEEMATSLCSGLSETNNEVAYKTLSEIIAQNSGFSASINDHCQ